MGNDIHHVPSNSHTSGATVRDSGHAAALPAGNPGSQGLKQELQHCPCCLPECPSTAQAAVLWALALPRLPSHSCHGALALLAQGELQPRSLGKQLLPAKACTSAPGAHAGTSPVLTEPCNPHLQTPWWQSHQKISGGKLRFLVRVRHFTCPGLKWSLTSGFSSRFCATSSHPQRGADLGTGMGKVGGEH